MVLCVSAGVVWLIAVDSSAAAVVVDFVASAAVDVVAFAVVDVDVAADVGAVAAVLCFAANHDLALTNNSSQLSLRTLNYWLLTLERSWMTVECCCSANRNAAAAVHWPN